MDEIKSRYLYKILHIIYFNLSVNSLVESGLEYSQIAQLLLNVVKKGLAKDSDEGLILTEKGKKQFEELKKRMTLGNKPDWIMPADKYRIEKIDKFDIYLPKRKV